MHVNGFISALMRLWLTAMVLTALSCSKKMDEDDTGSQNPPGVNTVSQVTVEFNILDPDKLPGTKTHPEDYTGDQDGTASENTINNIYLFAVDYDAESGTETVEEIVKADLVPGDFTPSGVRTGHTFELKSGTKRFYVGANMTEQHVNAFRDRTTLKADSYEEALALVMDNYQTKTGEGTNILMLSEKATTDGTTGDIEINGSKYLYLTARLERLVSKVMVTANYTGNKTDADGRSGENIRYIETENGFFFDFQFILNNTNRTLNIRKEYDGNALFNVDNNWRMSDIVEKDNSGILRYKTMWNCTDNFSTWEGNDIKDRLNDPTEWWCSAIPSAGSDYLGNGFYCLENTVFDDYSTTAGLTEEEKVKAAYLTTTHLYIKARFAPKTINGDSDGSTNKTDARISHLYWNTDATGQYRYSFYIHKSNQKFFTHTGAKRWVDNNSATWDDFETYLGGWVYFKTFFEEGGKDNVNGKITYSGITHWGIRRNDYCILNVKTIENWGSADPGEAFIKVSSETVPWVKRGSSDITVTPE